MQQEKPQRFNESQMDKVGIIVLDKDKILLQCKKCNQKWTPNLLSGGRLPKNYWHCIDGCNC